MIGYLEVKLLMYKTKLENIAEQNRSHQLVSIRTWFIPMDTHHPCFRFFPNRLNNRHERYNFSGTFYIVDTIGNHLTVLIVEVSLIQG